MALARPARAAPGDGSGRRGACGDRLYTADRRAGTHGPQLRGSFAGAGCPGPGTRGIVVAYGCGGGGVRAAVVARNAGRAELSDELFGGDRHRRASSGRMGAPLSRSARGKLGGAHGKAGDHVANNGLRDRDRTDADRHVPLSPRGSVRRGGQCRRHPPGDLRLHAADCARAVPRSGRHRCTGLVGGGQVPRSFAGHCAFHCIAARRGQADAANGHMDFRIVRAGRTMAGTVAWHSALVGAGSRRNGLLADDHDARSRLADFR